MVWRLVHVELIIEDSVLLANQTQNIIRLKP